MVIPDCQPNPFKQRKNYPELLTKNLSVCLPRLQRHTQNCKNMLKHLASRLTRPLSHLSSRRPAQTASTHIRIPDPLPTDKYPNRNDLQLGDYEKIKPKDAEDIITISVLDRDGDSHVVKGKINDNLMFLMQEHDIEIEGACEASLACCTCHVYVDEDNFDKLPLPEEDEDDMLDLAPFLKENSRLGCQILLHKELEGMEIEVPSVTRNFYVDGHVPEPH